MNSEQKRFYAWRQFQLRHVQRLWALSEAHGIARFWYGRWLALGCPARFARKCI